MRITDLHIKILALIVMALLVFLVLLPKTKTNQESNSQISGLVPQALEVFGYCLDAAVSGEPLTAEALEAALNSNTERRSSLIEYLKTDLEDNFECIVEVPEEFYDPSELRLQFEILKQSRFDGKMKFCGWGASPQGIRASILNCSLNHDDANIANSFRVSLAIIARDSAFFWIRPMYVFDSEGRIVSIN